MDMDNNVLIAGGRSIRGTNGNRKNTIKKEKEKKKKMVNKCMVSE